MYKIIVRYRNTGRQKSKRFYESKSQFQKEYDRWTNDYYKKFYIVEAYESDIEWEIY